VTTGSASLESPSADIGPQGGSPVRSSKSRTPRAQKSTERSCPRFKITSGATYSGVPQKVLNV
jgi:hypothetical protein